MAGRSYQIKAIVEGQGEARAIPALIQRWLRHERHHDFRTADEAMCAHGVDNLVSARPDTRGRPPNRQRSVEYFVGIAARQQADAILIVLDADERCAQRGPARAEALGPEILRRARAEAAHLPIGVVVADPEFEAWFLMPPCLEAMRHAGLIPPERWPDDPSSLPRRRNCKKTVSGLLGRVYSPSVDQRALCEHLQFTEAFRAASRSYGKLLRELARLTAEVRARR